MKPRLNDYLIQIGKLALAGAFFEEVVIRWGALLNVAPHNETHAKHLRAGAKRNLDFLVKQLKQRVSVSRQRPVLDLIETGRVLTQKRNENVHAVWAEMVEADTGAFSHVARSQYDTDASGKLIWIPHIVPTVSELEQFATELHKSAWDLHKCLSDLWDTDEQIQYWRATKGNSD